MALLYEDLVKAQTANPPTYGAQGQVTNPGQANVIPPPAATSGPPPANTQTQDPSGQPTGDPLTIFNQKLMDMLSTAQKGSSNAPLYNEANRLNTVQTDNSMKSAADLGIDNLAPGDALAARKSAAGEYDPAVKNINDRISLNNEAISKFTDAINAAKSFGEDYVKYVKPDDATITAVKQQMAAGFLPSATILDKVGKFLTADDWSALAKAKNSSTGGDAPSSYKEYALTTDKPTPAGYAAFLDRNKSSGGGGATVTERLLGKQSDIISAAKKLPVGENGKMNPNDYLDKASDFVAANGTVADFLAAVPPTRYLTPGDASYVKNTLTSTSGRSL